MKTNPLAGKVVTLDVLVNVSGLVSAYYCTAIFRHFGVREKSRSWLASRGIVV
jgi:hypothetical protein